MRSSLAATAFLVGVFACGKSERSAAIDPDRQSHAEALRVMCDAPVKCCPGTEPTSLDVAIYLENKVTNPEVVRWMKSLGAQEPDQVTASVRAELAKAKISVEDCPIEKTFGKPAPRRESP